MRHINCLPPDERQFLCHDEPWFGSDFVHQEEVDGRELIVAVNPRFTHFALYEAFHDGLGDRHWLALRVVTDLDPSFPEVKAACDTQGLGHVLNLLRNLSA